MKESAVGMCRENVTFLLCVPGLNYDCCVTKMRQLTLASMAAQMEAIPFASLGEELQLPQEELEDFVVDCECRRGVLVVRQQDQGIYVL